jgi:hypothetical protein
MLVGTMINEYSRKSKKGNIVTMYVYEIDRTQATADELADYELTQGSYYKESDNGNPIFQSINWTGDVTRIVKSKSYDENGVLVDSYKTLGTEDFRFKKMVYTAQIDSFAPKATTEVVAQKPVQKVADMKL